MKPRPRKLSENLLFALKTHPVVFVNGPRQAGKSTLVRQLLHKEYPAEYISFDNAMHMSAAASDPAAFLTQGKGPLIIDEVQMVPELFRELKIVVDELRLKDKSHSHGRYLLTGSANIMALPQLSDPLVGRMSVKTLYPFSSCEVLKGTGDFLERLFLMDFESAHKKYNLADVISLATFPEISGKNERESREWFDGYLTTLLHRDVRMIAEIEKVNLLPVLLRTLAVRSGHLINDAEIARDIRLNPVTSKSYRAILQSMFLNFTVEPWYKNRGKRLVKASKGYLVDTMLLCYVLEWHAQDLRSRNPKLYGHVVENFVASELLKLLSFSSLRANLFHFRTSDNKEVDFVLERPDGSLAGIEVKTSEQVHADDFKGLKVLQQLAEDDFVCGIVFYSGQACVPFGDKLFAVPLSFLWI